MTEAVAGQGFVGWPSSVTAPGLLVHPRLGLSLSPPSEGSQLPLRFAPTLQINILYTFELEMRWEAELCWAAWDHAVFEKSNPFFSANYGCPKLRVF